MAYRQEADTLHPRPRRDTPPSQSKDSRLHTFDHTAPFNTDNNAACLDEDNKVAHPDKDKDAAHTDENIDVAHSDEDNNRYVMYARSKA